MPRKGRELELVLELIERLRIEDAEVRSPMYVKNVDTEEEVREVDIGIIKKVNNGKIFIPIECRDRGATQDVTWVEQLISKKESVDADVLVAVTSSDFSHPALVKAKKRGVILRKVEKLCKEDLFLLTDSLYIEVHSIGIKVFPESTEIFIIDPPWQDMDITKCLYRNTETGAHHDFLDFISHALLPLREVIEKRVPIRSNIREKGNFKIDNYVVLIPSGVEGLNPAERPIESVTAEFEAVSFVDKYPASSLYKYKESESDDLLAEMYQFQSIGKIVMDTKEALGEWYFNINNLRERNRILNYIAIKNPTDCSLRSVYIRC